jgi:hypothetical protein
VSKETTRTPDQLDPEPGGVRRLPTGTSGRWSKRTEQLVRYVAGQCQPSLQSELGRWIEDSPRFAVFVAANQDKIRKKLSTADGTDGRLDVRSELRVAQLLLADRRFEVEFEAYGAKRAGPDLTATYRANQRFNLEVTRLRTPAPDAARLGNVMAAKVRQLPPELPNALVVTGQDTRVTEALVGDAARLLKGRNDASDDAFFERRGLGDARNFYAHYLRLSGVLVLDEASLRVFWPNPEARHRLNDEVISYLARC